MKKLLLLTFIITAAWLAAAASEVSKTTLAYAVKGTDTLRLDRYTVALPAATAKPRPCIIFMFGGGFTGGERDNAEYTGFFNSMAQWGADVVSIDYRLGLRNASEADFSSPEKFALRLTGAIGMAVEDLYTATSFVLGKATEWGIDPGKIVVCGSSAGAISVLQAEYGLCNPGTVSEMLPAGFGYAGVISFAGAIFSMAPSLTWATPPAPMLLFHGTNDSNVPYGTLSLMGAGFIGSESIAASLQAASSPYAFYSVRGADHSVATSPMKYNIPEIQTFMTQLVLEGYPLMERTDVTVIGTDTVQKQFTIMDYINTNFAPAPAHNGAD